MTAVISGQVDIGFQAPKHVMYNEGKDYAVVFAQLTKETVHFSGREPEPDLNGKTSKVSTSWRKEKGVPR